MKLHNVLTLSTLAGSLFALAPQAYADNDQGIDFNTGPNSLAVTSISITTPNVLATVTATCPQAGFLFATASSQFNVTPGVVNGAQFLYSLAKDATGVDNATRYDVVIREITSLSFLPASSLMRVDSCSAGQSVTYRFVAVKGVDVSKLTAVRPKLVVTFSQAKI